MGQKTNPIANRVGIFRDWHSKWFSKKDYKKFLIEDLKIRNFLDKELEKTSIDKVDIERSVNSISIFIYTSRPGVIIGRGGSGIEELRKKITKMIGPSISLRLEIQEVKNPYLSASIVAKMMAEQIEKRIPYRRVLKGVLEKVNSNKEVKGAKVLVSGRLDGAEISRREWLAKGRLPLATLRADIDFGQATAFTTYGTVGVKVWIYKGEYL